MDIEFYLKEKRKFIEGEIEKYLKESHPHLLFSAFEYSLKAGKRFRPMLVLASAEICGEDQRKVIPTALGIEMIHNFSLIHDDLPCMDNDDFRRGRPTCHKQFGEVQALLAGDGLLIAGFEMIAKNAEIEGIKPEAIVRCLKLISRSVGVMGMTGGQVMDMQFQTGRTITEEELLELHRKKTGALIRAACMSGAILTSRPEEEISALSVYGENIGLTFQIIDDLLDMDEDKKNISFPWIFGVERSRQMAEESTAKAVESLKVFGDKAEPLIKLAEFLLNRKV